MSVDVARKHFTVHDFSRMVEAGILSEDDRLELIEGEVLEMSPIGSRHAACVKRLNAILSQRLASTYIVSVQDPILLGEESAPQPDLALVTYRDDYYTASHPTKDDVVLVIEVADTSLEYDRRKKLPLYAAASIPEVWLVDLTHDVVHVYTRPANGRYTVVARFGKGDAIRSAVLADAALDVDSLVA